MPIYDYECQVPWCATIFERFYRQGEKISEVVRCPDCGVEAERIFSVPNIKTSKKSPDAPLGPSLGYSELLCRE